MAGRFGPRLTGFEETCSESRHQKTNPMSNQSPKQILVTGGAGFIGSHLCERLLGQGHHVYCLDNFFTGLEENVAPFMQNPAFTLLRHDIIDPIDVKVDQIYNLACPASPPHYQHDPIKTMKTSVFGILNMLELAKRHGARLLHASTSEVYGDPEVHPQPETYRGSVNPIGIRACYDEGKRAAETLCFDYHRRFGTEIRVVRIFNTYGPRMDPKDGRVVSNFIMQALRGEDLTIYGDGSQTRSFCYVDDLVRGFLDFMAKDNFTGPMNLGNDGEFTVRQLAELVLEMTGSQSRLALRPLPQDDPLQRKPDLTLARAQIGYQTPVALREGLSKTIDFFRSCV